MLKRSSLLFAAALAAAMSAGVCAQAYADDITAHKASYSQPLVAVFSRDLVAPVAVADLVAVYAADKPHVALAAASQYELSRDRQKPVVTPGWRQVPSA